MDATLSLKNKPNVIGAASNFTYHWGLNSGLDNERAVSLAVAISELVTDVVLFAFVAKEGELEMSFVRHPDQVEIVISETGEPFNPDRHIYDADRAWKSGDFDGAGFELVKAFSDEFIYINKGKQGKEFRILQKIKDHHISKYFQNIDLSKEEVQPGENEVYQIRPTEEHDAEDISKLIYRTYGHTYYKEALYFPRKISIAIQQKEKFGVIARTKKNEPAGSFSILMSTDSNIGEVGEAVVAVRHRRRGLMTRMLGKLVEEAKRRQLYGVFGEANAAHTISQRTNAKYDFKTTALLLGMSVPMDMVGFDPELASQRISGFFDFLPLIFVPLRIVFFPPEYKSILGLIYQSLKISYREAKSTRFRKDQESDIDVNIKYEHKFSFLVVKLFGNDFQDVLEHILVDLESNEIESVCIDLPLDDPGTKSIIPYLKGLKFIFSGLMPLYHHEKDYLRMQKLYVSFNFDFVIPYSKMAMTLKNLILTEYNEVQNL